MHVYNGHDSSIIDIIKENDVPAVASTRTARPPPITRESEPSIVQPREYEDVYNGTRNLEYAELVSLEFS